MLGLKHRYNRGDTLIEVLFATAIFSLVAVGGLSIMNQGAATSQRALEITLVRNEVDSQAEALRFLNASYIAAYQSGAGGSAPSVILTGPARQWQIMQGDIINTDNTKASDFGLTNTGTCPVAPTGSFIIDAKNAMFILPTSNKLKSAITFSQAVYTSGSLSEADGIWIEAVRPKTVTTNNQSNAGYIDFNIRACWDSPGQSAPVTIGTIVRLYEPRG